MLTIGDLVSLDDQAQFRSDVQLDAYDDPVKNLSLLRSYLFSGSAPDRDVAGARSISSVGLLGQIIEPLLNQRLPNRLVAIANYGHGKSHLALALANYFGKPVDSPEVSTILNKIAAAETDPAKAARYRDFKHSRGEFLVIRLRGDLPRAVHEQFVSGIERALAEHPSTADIKPGFWFSVAENLLRRLSPTDRRRADEFLEQFATDVPQLLQQVELRKDVYDQCVRLFTDLHGVRPDLGGEVSLKEVVNWVVKTCCGEDKPFAGLFVLFDEFSLYVQKYAQSGTLGELQDLLNGIQDQRGKAVFLAFAQHDPETVADNLAIANQSRDNLKRELGRLEKKFALYSLLESVIAAYLRQSDRAWQTFNLEPRVRGWLHQATDVTLETFKGRYDRGLRWTTEKFQDTVTKGCFPLHPLTTALLCNLNYGPAGDFGVPRTVLGFVLEQWDRCQQMPAFDNGRVNWILPIYLVDYFESRLHGDTYAAYQNARRLLNEEAPPQQIDVLKALLLQEIAGIQSRGDDQCHFLGQCVGLDEQLTKQALKALSEAKAIRFDPIRKVNSFWSPSTSPDKLQDLLRKRLEEQSFDPQALMELQRAIADLPDVVFGKAPVSVSWGEPSDWAAHEAILSVDVCTADRLQKLVRPFAIGPKEVVPGVRGWVFWLIARDEMEVQWYRLNLLSEVDQAFAGDAPIPMVFVIPAEPSSELVNAFLRYRALTVFDQNEREAAGQQMYDTELGLAKKAIAKAFYRLRGEDQNCFDTPKSAGGLGIPLAYRAQVSALPHPTVRSVLTECYRLAYRNAPPEYFTQYKVSQRAHRNAVRMAASLLLQNSPEALQQSIRAEPVARDLCDKFLQRRWRVLTPDFRLQEPVSEPVRRAWESLDESFQPSKGETPVRGPLVALLNTPHGYDYNTATLLFCAWFGYHSHDLQISMQGQVVSRDVFAQSLQNGPKEFIDAICIENPTSFVRRDPGKIIQEIRVIHERVQKGSFTPEQAEEAITILKEFVRDERQPRDARENAQRDIEVLTDATRLAQEYVGEVAQIDKDTASFDLVSLTRTLTKVGKLPRTGIVEPTAPSLAEIRQQVVFRIETAVNQDCLRYENIVKLTQVDESLGQLRRRKSILTEAGLSNLVDRVDQAIHVVEQKVYELEVRDREEAFRVEIRGMDTNSRLSRLYEFQARLQVIDGQSEETQYERDRQLLAVTKEIGRLEQVAASWQSGLEKAGSLAQLERQHSDLLRTADRFAGTSYESDLARVQARAELLRDFFNALSLIEHDFTSGRMSTPTDADQAIRQVDQIAQNYASALAESHQKKLSEVTNAIKAQGLHRSRQALAWLSEREEEFRAERPPSETIRRLAAVPAFLPVDAQPRLEVLKSQIQQRIDEDAIVSIEMQFRKIADVRKRQACLERLQSIMTEP